MELITVRPKGPLQGRVAVGGAKNSVLKLMAACLLAEGHHVLDNVPRIADVHTMAGVLEDLGASVEWLGEHTLDIGVPGEPSAEAPWGLTERMRASIVLLGPLTARLGEARVPLPGGDDFGGRPIDFHVKGLEAMGAAVELDHGYVVTRTPGRLSGAMITLEFASHTATDNLLMAAVLAKGRTVIDNAAREPEVADLAAFLCSMGARVRGAGTSRIEVEGIERLQPARHRVLPDRVEAATFLSAVGVAGGEIVVEGAEAAHMRMLLEKLGEMGVRVTPLDEGLLAMAPRRLQAVDVATLPYPGVATDYKPLVVSMLCLADGVGIVTENLFFGGRFRYVDELRRMGADVRADGHHAVVRGVERLSGVPVRATDIRAGAALIVAGLGAEGETCVEGVAHIDRGYEDLVGKLSGLGADVSRRQERPS
ncbi:MAG: UDP-N-acetylglucosamine 1-carboxyvinyltransferase [Acidimicrobiales bacterium]